MSSQRQQLADPRTQQRIAERYRQVKSLLDKATPIMAQYNRGELRAVSGEQRRLLLQYPGLLTDLEELRQGRLPPVRPAPSASAKLPPPENLPVKAAAAPAATGNGNKAKDSAVTNGSGGRTASSITTPRSAAAASSATPNREGEDSNSRANSHKSGAAQEAKSHKTAAAAAAADDGEDEDDDDGDAAVDVDTDEVASEEDLLYILRAIKGQHVRDEMIDGYVERVMRTLDATAELNEADAKLSAANELKKKIISGAVKRPSNAQLAQIEALPQLRKSAANARKKAKKHEHQIRDSIFQKLEALDKGEEGDSQSEDADGDTTSSSPPVKSPSQPPVDSAAAAAAATAPVATESNESGVAAVGGDEFTEAVENPWSMEEAASPVVEVEEAQVTATSHHGAEGDAAGAEASAVGDANSQAAAAADAAEEGQEEEEEAHAEETKSADAAEEDADDEAAAKLLPGMEWTLLNYGNNKGTFSLRNFRDPGEEDEEEEDTQAHEVEGEAAEAAGEEEEEPEAAPVDYTNTSGVPPLTHDDGLGYVRRNICVGVDRHALAASLAAEAAAAATQGVVDSTETAAEPAWKAHVDREWELVCQYPIPRVRVYRTHTRPQYPAQEASDWHVDVLPLDGPLAGEAVHLVLHFPPAYPFVPPQVYSPASMRHPGFMLSQSRRSNALFLTFDSGDVRREGFRADDSARRAAAFGGWQPDMDVRAVLRQLQTFFDAPAFVRVEKSMGEEPFLQEMRNARLAIARQRASCKECVRCLSSVEAYNGPFLSASAPVPVDAEADGKEDSGSEGNSHHQRLHSQRVQRISSNIVSADGIAGPCRVCWGHVLYTLAAEGKDDATEVSLLLQFHRVIDEDAPQGEEEGKVPTVRIHALPAESTLPQQQRQITKTQHSSPSTTAKPSEKVEAWQQQLIHCAVDDAHWSLPSSAWESPTVSVRITQEGAAAVDDAAATATSNHTFTASLPAHAAPQFFGLVIDVPAGQLLRLIATTTVPHNSEASDDTDVLSSPLPELWGTAKRLLSRDAQGSDGNEEDDDVHGMLLGVPMETSPLIAEEARHIPRAVSFMWHDGTVPALLPETAFRRYLELLPRRGPPVVPNTAADNSMYAMPGDVWARWQHSGEKMHSISAVTEASQYFFGPRALFLPFFFSSTVREMFSSRNADTTGVIEAAKKLTQTEREGLDRFLRGCAQLYRQPGASMAYEPPVRPVQILHTFSLALVEVLKQRSALAKTVPVSEIAQLHVQLLSCIIGELLLTAALVAAVLPSFLHYCTDRATERMPPQGGLFLCSPFVPLSVVRGRVSEKKKVDGNLTTPSSSCLSYISSAYGLSIEQAAAREAELEVAANIVGASVVVLLLPAAANSKNSSSDAAREWAAGVLSGAKSVGVPSGTSRQAKVRKEWASACSASLKVFRKDLKE